MKPASMITNTLSFDIEEHFQVAAFDGAIDRGTWRSQPSRVVNNTQQILYLLDEAGIKATFFILSWVAEREPALIRDIAAAGHEVASHGYSHRLIYTQSISEFRQETIRSKKLLEDIVQAPVTCYRAASYSITRDSLWALDVLFETGFRTDSSIFPIRHDLYGLTGGPVDPYHLDLPGGGRLLEFPITTTKVAGLTLPVSGGGYFRLYPYSLSRWLARKVNAAGRPFMFYLHPWEVDPGQPRIDASAFSRFRHYNNLDKTAIRLKQLLKDFRFSTMSDCLAEYSVVNDLTTHSYSPAAASPA